MSRAAMRMLSGISDADPELRARGRKKNEYQDCLLPRPFQQVVLSEWSLIPSRIGPPDRFATIIMFSATGLNLRKEFAVPGLDVPANVANWLVTRLIGTETEWNRSLREKFGGTQDAFREACRNKVSNDLGRQLTRNQFKQIERAAIRTWSVISGVGALLLHY